MEDALPAHLTAAASLPPHLRAPGEKFRIPTLITSDMPAAAPSSPLDNSLLSPRRSSLSITVNSPKAAAAASSAASPRTPSSRFEDPMMAWKGVPRPPVAAPPAPSEPSFSGSSPSFARNSLTSPSFARRQSFDFRRSLPGSGPNSSTSIKDWQNPADAAMRLHDSGRGGSDFGGPEALFRSRAGSVAGDPQGHESEPPAPPADDSYQDFDAELPVSRRLQSLHAQAMSPGTASGGPLSQVQLGGAIPALAYSQSMRISEDDEFMRRLQQSRNSWRSRANSGTTASSSEGLQNQTHAALEQLRGELKSASLRTLRTGSSMLVRSPEPAPQHVAVAGANGASAPLPQPSPSRLSVAAIAPQSPPFIAPIRTQAAEV